MFDIVLYVFAAIGALVVLLIGLAALPLYSNETPLDVADSIEEFLRIGRDGSRDYDEFLCIRAKDPQVNDLKKRLNEIDDSCRTRQPPHYLSDEGLQALRGIAEGIRSSAA